MDIRQLVEETLVAPMRAMATRPHLTVAEEAKATEAAIAEMRIAWHANKGFPMGMVEVELILKRIDRLQMLADAYRRVSSDHEDMVSDLLKLLDNDDLDAARDIVQTEYRSIHGPND